jgi:N-acetylneuraminic acid mutarotase
MVAMRAAKEEKSSYDFKCKSDRKGGGSVTISDFASTRSRTSPFRFLIVEFALIAGFTMAARGQANEWAWMGGSELGFQPGMYGLMGDAGPKNIPGGRVGAARWVDQDGDLWIFGGGGINASLYGQGGLNDLWMFNPSQNEWTWIDGGSVNTHDSVCTGGSNCVAPAVYGTEGIFAPENIPGGRNEATGWVDARGHFWMFGGYGDDRFPYKPVNQYCFLNEMWEYDPSTNEWAWMTGSNEGWNQSDSPRTVLGEDCGQPGVYGTLGKAAPENTPGSRIDEQTWTDRKGNFWMFGGFGKDEFGQDGVMNDLWMFDPNTKQWTWMGGGEKLPPSRGVDGDVGLAGVYGTLGVPAPENIPGSRAGAATWADSDGDLWLFGGGGYDEQDAGGPLNDMWKYDLSIHEWTWMAGKSKLTTCVMANINTPCGWTGAYGKLGVPDAKNIPGGRSGGVTWKDREGNIWIFSGGGAGIIPGQFGSLSDIWMFNPSTSEWTWMGGPEETAGCSTDPQYDVTICGGWPGIYARRLEPDASNLPGSRGNAAGWSDNDGNFWVFGGDGYDVTGNESDLNDVWRFEPSTAVLPPAVAPLFSEPPGLYSDGGLLKLSNGMPDAKFYYTTDGTTPTTHSKLYQGAFKVAASETVKAIASVPGYRTSGVSSSTYVISPLFPPTFSYGTGSYDPPIQLVITERTPGTTVYYTLNGTVPTSKSMRYTGALPITEDQIVSAVAITKGGVPSEVIKARFTILKKQTITFAQPKTPVTYGVKPITLVAEANSGLPVTFSVLSGPATIRNSELTIYGPGTVVVSADQPGTLIWDPAEEVTRTIIVNPAK